ncbi:MAG: hypothetical protein IPP63_19625 [Chloracidobacterium sp.]|nr:hypothetical protein [Chloracidobacterium sp.]
MPHRSHSLIVSSPSSIARAFIIAPAPGRVCGELAAIEVGAIATKPSSAYRWAHL